MNLLRLLRALWRGWFPPRTPAGWAPVTPRQRAAAAKVKALAEAQKGLRSVGRENWPTKRGRS